MEQRQSYNSSGLKSVDSAGNAARKTELEQNLGAVME